MLSKKIQINGCALPLSWAFLAQDHKTNHGNSAYRWWWRTLAEDGGSSRADPGEEHIQLLWPSHSN